MMLWIEKTYTAYSDELASDFEFSVAFGVSGTVAVGASGAGGLPLHREQELGLPEVVPGRALKQG